MIIRAKNWGEFQHYKDRDPSWIKLHKKLLDNYEFHSLPIASKALAPMLWLLVSESRDGGIEASEEKLAFRLHISVSDLADALMPLVQSGFFDLERNDSESLAKPELSAIPEKEKQVQLEKQERQIVAEATPARKRASKPPDVEPEGFAEFYQAYPKHVDRAGALKAYRQATKKVSPEIILAGAKRYAAEKRGVEAEYLKMPAGWLNNERWNDGEDGKPRVKAGYHSSEEMEAQRLMKERMHGQTTQ